MKHITTLFFIACFVFMIVVGYRAYTTDLRNYKIETPASSQIQKYESDQGDVQGDARTEEKVGKETERVFCGGVANIQCPNNEHCIIDGNYPDAGGYCLKKQ